MPFYLPNFNLVAMGWAIGITPNTGAPEWDEWPCQLYVQPRQPGRGHEFQGEPQQPITTIMRMPTANFDAYAGTDIWEIPAHSGNYYKVFYKETMHLGFPNEYYALFVTQCDGDGTPVARFL